MSAAPSTVEALRLRSRSLALAGASAAISSPARARRNPYAIYRGLPVAYAERVLRVSLTDSQKAQLSSIVRSRRTVVKASHAVGKTFVAAIAACYWYDCWDEHIVYITAPTWSQALGLTFKQVRRFRLAARLPGDILDTGLVRDTDRLRRDAHFIKALNAESGEGFQGEHTAPVLVIVEEGVGVPRYIWEATEGLMTHPECFVAGTVVSGAKVVGSTARRYSGHVFEIVTRHGRRATVTENHPMLTAQGWIAARRLNEGDDLLCCSDSEAVASAVGDPDDYQVPARIEDVAASFEGAGVMASVCVPTAPEDFHGDGEGSDVCVVRADGLLRHDLDAALSEPLRQPNLVGGRDARTRLASLGGAAEFVKGLRPAAGGCVRGGDDLLSCGKGSSCRYELVPFGDGTGLHPGAREGATDGRDGDAMPRAEFGEGCASLIAADERLDVTRQPRASAHVGPGAATNFDARRFEMAGEGFRFDAALVGELLRAFPGNVAFDEIVEIRRVPFSGHVYNLETVNGWYIANGIITHNCRLFAIGNPTDDANPFGEACDSPLFDVHTVRALDHPNIAAELRGEPPPFPMAVRLLWLLEMLTEEAEQIDEPADDAFQFYDLDTVRAAVAGTPVPADAPLVWYMPTPYFQGRVLGEFPSQAESQVIPRGWLSSQPVLAAEGEPEIGCDVARFGDDRSTAFLRRGPAALAGREVRKFDSVAVAEMLKDMARYAAEMCSMNVKRVLIKIDVTGGLGTGPLDILLAEKYRAVGVNSSSRANNVEQFKNKRSELWFDTRVRAREKRLDLSRLPLDLRRRLEKELSTPKYKIDSGKKVVEEKAKMKERLGVSPDLADGLNLAFAPVVEFDDYPRSTSSSIFA